MTTLLDGPAEGKVVVMRRHPYYIRIAWMPDATWEALDLLDAVPDDDADLYVYSRPKGSLANAYRFHSCQPTEFQMRDTGEWQKWCREQAGAVSDPCSSFCHPEESCTITETGICDAKAATSLSNADGDGRRDTAPPRQ
jgi:hypothetical protein